MKPESTIPATSLYADETPAGLLTPPTNAQFHAGVEPEMTLPAAWWNYFVKLFTSATIEAKSDTTSLLTEMTNVLAAFGITPSAVDNTQLKSILERMVIGDGVKSTTQLADGDANSIHKSGFYLLTGNTVNVPIPGSAWYIIHCEGATGINYSFQIGCRFLDTIGAAETYIRVTFLNIQISSWVKLWNASNDGAGSGSDADMIDGIQAERMIYGDDAAGTTFLDNGDPDLIIKTGSYRVSNAAPHLPATDYWNIQHIARGSTLADSATQIASSVTNGSKVYTRGKTGGTWGSWNQLFNSGNVGAGWSSLLLAAKPTTVDGYGITDVNLWNDFTTVGISTTVPLYSRIARITINTIYAHSIVKLLAANANSGLTNQRGIFELNLYCRQGGSFGVNPEISGTILSDEDYTLADNFTFSYKVIQNSPTTIIDVYIKHLVGYSMVVGKSLVGSEIYSDLLFYKNEATVASVSGVVDLVPQTRLKRGDFGIGSTRNGGGAFNFNSAYVRPGLYNFAGSESTGAPLGTDGAGTVYRNAYRNIDTPGNNYISDIVVYMQSISSVIEKGGRMFFRSWLAGDTPGEWQELYHTGNSPVGPDGWPLINGPVYGLTAQVGKSFTISNMGACRICKLSSRLIAAVDNVLDTLSTYAWNGSVFSQVGSSLALANYSEGAICRLSPTTIALVTVEAGNDVIKTYSWNGSTWSQIGSSYTYTGSTAIAVTTLGNLSDTSSSDIVVYEYTSRALKRYHWSGSAWSAVGTGLVLTGYTFIGLTALNASDIVVSDLVNNLLATYRWNGTTFALVGTALNIGDIANSTICALTDNQVMLVDDNQRNLRLYKWSGSTWAAQGTGLAIAGITAPSLCALNNSDVVLADSTLNTLTVYKTI